MSIVRRWLLGREHREVPDFIGEKVEYLFRQVRHPSGREYTVRKSRRRLADRRPSRAHSRQHSITIGRMHVVGCAGSPVVIRWGGFQPWWCGGE